MAKGLGFSFMGLGFGVKDVGFRAKGLESDLLG